MPGPGSYTLARVRTDQVRGCSHMRVHAALHDWAPVRRLRESRRVRARAASCRR